ncbi:MAG TPA: signal peptidase I, partial [Acholeplasma sp.]|nr:signal peptidase I [Acholeplasma sp.]
MIRKIILNALTTVLLLFLTTTLVLTLFNINVHAVVSDSMNPTIKKYDLVYVKYLSNEEKLNLEEEDIVLISASTPFIHRIIDVKEENGIVQYETMGDHNEASDGYYDANRMIGKYQMRIPLIGFFFVELEITIV